MFFVSRDLIIGILPLLIYHLTTGINLRLAVIVEIEVLLLRVIHVALRHTGSGAGTVRKHLIGVRRYQSDV